MGIASLFFTARALLARIPWWVWPALAIAGAWWWDRTAQYREGYSEGRESVLAQLRAAEARARDKATEAASEAQERATERAVTFEAKQTKDKAAITEAKANDTNALDALF